MDKYERIEDAICKLEKLICDELDIDIGHYILEPLGAENLFYGLRSRLEDRQELDNLKNLKAWQDGSLINTDAINKLSLGDLERVSKILEGVK